MQIKVCTNFFFSTVIVILIIHSQGYQHMFSKYMLKKLL